MEGVALQGRHPGHGLIQSFPKPEMARMSSWLVGATPNGASWG